MASSISVSCPKTTAALVVPSSQPLAQSRHGRLSFPLGSTFSGLQVCAQFGSVSDSLLFGTPIVQWPSKKGSSVSMVRAQLNEVAAKESVNNSVSVDSKSSDAQPDEKKDAPKGRRVPDSASLSEFMEQVSDLVKLVDSRDIMELKLKQLDCEIEIRKKEALPQPPPPQVMMMQSPYQQHAMQAPPPPPPAAAASPAPAAAKAPTLALPPPAKAASAHPPMGCPMAGTFYRCPAPGEPPFVKVGDTVQKGQVVCIIEAMKLMNEIEADKSGTIVEVVAEDGKPVTIGTPLFVIA
ncbi:Biotin carboxyl carrier protein of acetyl-CoA carboxylase 2, chloroplastic [Linum grandiflorum]